MVGGANGGDAAQEALSSGSSPLQFCAPQRRGRLVCLGTYPHPMNRGFITMEACVVDNDYVAAARLGGGRQADGKLGHFRPSVIHASLERALRRYRSGVGGDFGGFLPRRGLRLV